MRFRKPRSNLTRGAPFASRFFLAGIVAVLMTMLVSTSVLAVHETPFEIDGNSADGVAAGTDWDVIIGAACNLTETGGGVDVATCVVDPLTGDEGYQGGQSGPLNDIDEWGWASAQATQTPGKNNIVTAFGAVKDGVLAFGLTREEAGTGGNTAVSFWFLQDKVVLGPPTTGNLGRFYTDGTFTTLATHTLGDIFVVSEFTNGGNIANLAAYEWVGSGGSNGALDLIFATTPGTNTGCDPTDVVCVGVNNASITPSWTGALAASVFFEGSIDLAALGLSQNSCISQFIAETRASQSLTAQVHDFALGDLSTCGSITIVKDTIPNAAQDFSFTATGGGMSNFVLDDDADPTLSNTKTFDDLVPGGGARTVTEGAVAGYAVTEIACVGDTNSTITIGAAGGFDPGDTSVSIVLAASEHITCTFTNEPLPQLKLVKTVTNDNGGTAVPDDWTLHATGSGGFSNLGGSGVFNIVEAGVSYALSETGGPAGYAAGAWGCDGGDQAGASITLTFGDVVTCTINNNDIAPQLKLVKTVTNDNGGTAVADDWTLTATGAGGFSNLGGSGVFTPVNAGVDYALSEAGPTGYAAGSWSCDGGTQVGSTITLALAQQVTCTINNNDSAPQLKLVKVVVNGANGTAVADDWTLTATGAGGFSNLGGSGVFTPVNAGVGYALSEAGPTGYAAGSWSCDGGTQVGSTITLALAQQVTCTITNSRLAQIIVDKVTVGGGTQVFDFSLTGQTNFQLADADAPFDTGVTLTPGNYTACELDLAVSWSTTVTVNGNPVALVNPDAPADLGNRCVTVSVDFGDITTIVFTNTPPPGGDARTIGYWRNWSSCTNGMQWTKALAAGNWDKTLDGNLPQTIGNLTLVGAPGAGLASDDCPEAVNILSKRDINGGNKGGDAAYNLAAQLLAALLNQSAGAGSCVLADNAIADALKVLGNGGTLSDGTTVVAPGDAAGFTGLGDYWKGGKNASPLRTLANELAGILDAYNNNTLCP